MRLILSLGLILWNLIAFVVYGLDKRRAIKGAWRISEKSLILLSLAGAGLGSALASHLFHHKTRKWYFRFSWALGLLIDLLLIYCLWRFKNEWTINF
ncbi:DUF1294 domain-containing protein [Streptococcus tangpeifui]|uniref:DUF1294 domain-containing protein n=1 Tax=Streptococcus tangpeifui TaxID=2709400 RepID=UPI0013E9C759|nr:MULTISPECIES: DUF1294 domain-containing protein [unclassified Streptococcus]